MLNHVHKTLKEGFLTKSTEEHQILGIFQKSTIQFTNHMLERRFNDSIKTC